MRIYVMTDLEGVAGVLDFERWCSPGKPFYPKARELLSMEVNASIEGFFSAGASEILVVDGHGPRAIVPDLLNQRAKLACHGFPLEKGRFDFIAFVGQHPMAGTTGGHLSHTGSFGVVQQTINGMEVGEYGDLVLTASELGIRTILATGCEAFCREAKTLVHGLETVAVKRGIQTEPGNHLPGQLYSGHNRAAVHLHPEEARRRIKSGAEKALRRAANEPFGLAELPAPPYTKTIIRRWGTDPNDGKEYPPRIFFQTHPKSLAAMHREPYTGYELNINPADPHLRTLFGKKTA